MARARDPNRYTAYKLWLDSNREIKLKDIAMQLNVSEGTVRGWKNKDKWELPIEPADLSATSTPKKTTERSNQTERNAPNVPKNTERSKEIPERNEPPPEMDNEDGSLTDKQRLFVMEYLRDFNATRAAMAVGYSKKTAYAIGWENLRKPQIQTEIQRQKEAMTSDLGLGVQRVIAEYMKIAFADITDLLEFGQQDIPMFTDDGMPINDPNTGEQMTYKRNFVAFRNSEEVDGTVVGEVKQGKDGVSVKLHDKMKAMAALEKYLGFMTEEQRLRVEKLKGEVKLLEQKASSDDDKPIEILIKRKGDSS